MARKQIVLPANIEEYKQIRNDFINRVYRRKRLETVPNLGAIVARDTDHSFVLLRVIAVDGDVVTFRNLFMRPGAGYYKEHASLREVYGSVIFSVTVDELRWYPLHVIPRTWAVESALLTRYSIRHLRNTQEAKS